MARQHGQVRGGIGTYKLKDGSTRWRVVRRVNGKPTTKGGFRSKDDARRYLNRLNTAVDTGRHVAASAGRISFEAWATHWRQHRTGIRQSTQVRDDAYLDNYVIPAFGDRPLAGIGHTDVQDWVAQLAARGSVRTGRPLAPATVQKAYQVLAKVLKAAVLAGRLAESPCHDIDLPTISRDEARFLTPAELLRLEQALEATEPQRYRRQPLPSRYGLLVPFLADTGLRIGEAAALRWRDIDLAARTVYVRQTVVEVKGQVEFNQPKTKAGRRAVPMLTDEVADRLAAHTATFGIGPDDYLWMGEGGGVLRPTHFRRRVWKPAIAEAGLADPQPTPHTLRHTAVAHWIAAGVTDPYKLQRLLGHAGVASVYGIYGHLLPLDTTAERANLTAIRAQAMAADFDQASVRSLRAAS